MKIVFAGGAMEVGASCIYLQTEGKGILLDAGIRQSSGKDPLPDFRSIQNLGSVDVILVSHSHMDHIGSLPLISKAYPSADIYMTAMSMDLCRVLLYDSLKLMKEWEDEIPHYSEKDVERMLERIHPVNYRQRVEVLKGFHATFYPAGHIAGAACIDLQMEEGTVFYSGDVSMFPQRTIDAAMVPRLRPDIAICESTYGDRLHANREAEENRLAALVSEHVSQGHKVLIPCFALGRSQEVLLILKAAMAKKTMPEVPVYVDGMVRSISQVYKSHPTYLRRTLAQRILKGNEPFYSDCIRAVSNAENREELVKKDGAAVFVSSSGMLTGGPSVTYARLLAGDENACIIITGYQDEESPGRALLNLLEKKEKTIALGGVQIEAKCAVEMVGLSAHGDQMELSGLLDKISARHVILNHGSQGAISALSKIMATDYRRRIYMPQDGDVLDITLRNKRKQLDPEMKYKMNGTGSLEDLAEFWQLHYPSRSLGIEEILQAYGSQEDPQTFGEKLLESGLFARDKKRLFLFRVLSQEEREEASKKQLPTPQDVEAVIKGIYTDPLRKIGYYPEACKAVLSMDYPDAANKDMLKEAKMVLAEKTGWSLEVNPSVNFTAMGMLAMSLLGNAMAKSSYYLERKAFQVVLQEEVKGIEAIQAEFKRITGWKLEAGAKPETVEAPKANADMMEQNKLMAFVDQAYGSVKEKPYRKSLKGDANGRYLELSFTTPALGNRHPELLEQIRRETGWRVAISQKANQMALQQEAILLAKRHGHALTKVPSIRLMEETLEVDCPVDEDMKREFLDATGWKLKEKA